MPLYDYRCTHCGLEFEGIASSPNEEVTCTYCKTRVAERMMPLISPLKGIRAAQFKKSEAKKKRVNDIVKKQCED
jgi:putative FmdB family regulatory protein